MKVIFLDRDGVINEYPGDFLYVTHWRDFRFLPGVKAALKKLNAAGYKIFIISNQAGISKGVYPQSVLDEITENMLKELGASGVEISGVNYCIHSEEDNCPCRKPKTGLIDASFKSIGMQRRMDCDCFFIGDTMRDIQTGKAAGCKTILVFSGKEKPANKQNWTFQPDLTALALSQAVDLILKS
jgi:D-glycero-D-manno-heptose 1,7-bisphosphate phosphatase